MKDRTTANAVDRDPVNKVRAPVSNASADRSSKEAKGIRLNAGIPKPANVGPEATADILWEQRYGDFWKLKVAFDKKYNR